MRTGPALRRGRSCPAAAPAAQVCQPLRLGTHTWVLKGAHTCGVHETLQDLQRTDNAALWAAAPQQDRAALSRLWKGRALINQLLIRKPLVLSMGRLLLLLAVDFAPVAFCVGCFVSSFRPSLISSVARPSTSACWVGSNGCHSCSSSGSGSGSGSGSACSVGSGSGSGTPHAGTSRAADEGARCGTSEEWPPPA